MSRTRPKKGHDIAACWQRWSDPEAIRTARDAALSSVTIGSWADPLHLQGAAWGLGTVTCKARRDPVNLQRFLGAGLGWQTFGASSTESAAEEGEAQGILQWVYCITKPIEGKVSRIFWHVTIHRGTVPARVESVDAAASALVTAGV